MYRNITYILLTLSICFQVTIANTDSSFQTVEFSSIDGLLVTADLYETGDKTDPIIFAFHQSGSSRGEYRKIAPRLVKQNFNVLAVDVRWGARDQVSNIQNETAKRNGTPAILQEFYKGDNDKMWPVFFDSYNDMLAAIDWATLEEFSGKKLVLGSSATSILVFKVPNDRKIDAVLSFSPGEYYENDSTMVAGWCSQVTVPTYIATGVEEYDMSYSLYESVATEYKQFFQADTGWHGASMLNESESNWKSLIEFIEYFQNPQEVKLTTSDNIIIYGDYYTVDERVDKPIILLFHQGASNARAEYSPLIYKILSHGYHAIAIDQRRGGSRFGGVNRTLEHLDSTAEYSYCDTYPDLEASLLFADSLGYEEIIAWGSSYSSTISLKLATEHPDKVDAVLCFSTASGAPMEGCNPDEYLKQLKTPALFIRPPKEIHYPHIKDQMQMINELGLNHFVAQNGVHGSSILNDSRVFGSTEKTWQRVFHFLKTKE